MERVHKQTKITGEIAVLYSAADAMLLSMYELLNKKGINSFTFTELKALSSTDSRATVYRHISPLLKDKSVKHVRVLGNRERTYHITEKGEEKIRKLVRAQHYVAVAKKAAEDARELLRDYDTIVHQVRSVAMVRHEPRPLVAVVPFRNDAPPPKSRKIGEHEIV